MRNTGIWTAAFVAVPLLLMTAIPSLALPNEASSQPPGVSAQVSDAAIESDVSQSVTITLQLEDGISNTAQPSVVRSESSTLSSKISVLSKIRQVAIGYLGTRYRWGGTTPNAFDCSGFTRYVYSSLGVRIPRTAREQYKAGKPVKPAQMRTGDLVFFDMMKGYVSHVGLYLGDGVFIHASNPATGVKYSNINDRSYRKYFVGARRYQNV